MHYTKVWIEYEMKTSNKDHFSITLWPDKAKYKMSIAQLFPEENSLCVNNNKG